MSATAPLTAIVTAFDRVPQTLEALRRLRACDPAPAEILVHVDANRQDCAASIAASALADRVFVSETHVGPGGARNRLIEAAQYPLVASFDDDSWPLDPDYFARVLTLFERFPQAGVIAAALFHRGEPRLPASDRPEWRADFVGAGCAYRRDVFMATGGYVPLPTAYFMEEVDLALRLHAQHCGILYSPWLRVEHDTDLSHHAGPLVTSASLANIALLAFLRYPAWLWPVGLAQLVRRTSWLLSHGRRRGVGAGLRSIPGHLAAHRQLRAPLPAARVRSFLQLRRSPKAAA